MEKTNFAGFKVITGGKSSVIRAPEQFVQASLFADQRQHSLIFVTVPDVQESEFIQIVRLCKPGLIIELRPVPRFDIGHLDRQEVFEFFRAEECKYWDPGLDDPDWRDSNLLPTCLASASSELGKEAERPLMFLLGRSQDPADLRQVILRGLEGTSTEWNILEIPATSPKQALAGTK